MNAKTSKKTARAAKPLGSNNDMVIEVRFPAEIAPWIAAGASYMGQSMPAFVASHAVGSALACVEGFIAGNGFDKALLGDRSVGDYFADMTSEVNAPRGKVVRS